MLFVNSLQSCNAGPKNENQQPKICNSWRFIGHGPQVPTLLKKTYAIRNQNCTIQQHERKFEGVALCISSGEVVYGSLFLFLHLKSPLNVYMILCGFFYADSFTNIDYSFLTRILKFKQVKHSCGLFGFMLQLLEMFLFIYLYIMKWRVPVI